LFELEKRREIFSYFTDSRFRSANFWRTCSYQF
jgi:hypothetical protein